jgi:hypothetical protein
MEPFDTNIDIFYSINRYQRYFSLSNAENRWRLSLSSQYEIKKIIKINFYSKIEFEKKTEALGSYSLCYFESGRIKMYLFRNFWNTTDVWHLFISVPILLVPPLTKKSEAFGLKLWSNHLKKTLSTIQRLNKKLWSFYAIILIWHDQTLSWYELISLIHKCIW